MSFLCTRLLTGQAGSGKWSAGSSQPSHTHLCFRSYFGSSSAFPVVSRSGCLCNHGFSLPARFPSRGGPVDSGSTNTAPALAPARHSASACGLGCAPAPARHGASVCGHRRPSLLDALPLLLLHPLHRPEWALHHGVAQVRRTVELVAQGRAACVCGPL